MHFKHISYLKNATIIKETALPISKTLYVLYDREMVTLMCVSTVAQEGHLAQFIK